MNAKEFFHSFSFKGLLIGIIAVTAVLTAFEAGIFVGRHQAAFEMHEGDAYFKVAMHHSSGPFDFVGPGGEMSEHGASGKIVSITLPNLVIADPQNVEKTVTITDDTLIRNYDGTKDAPDIDVGDFAIVLGTPDQDSHIQAKFIRVLPPPASTTPPR